MGHLGPTASCDGSPAYQFIQLVHHAKYKDWRNTTAEDLKLEFEGEEFASQINEEWVCRMMSSLICG